MILYDNNDFEVEHHLIQNNFVLDCLIEKGTQCQLSYTSCVPKIIRPQPQVQRYPSVSTR